MWSTASETGLRDCCQLFQVGEWLSSQLTIWRRQSLEVTFHFLSNARKSVSGPLSLLPKVKRIIRYLLQANDEIRPLCSNLWNLCERRQLLYVRAPDEYMGYWLLSYFFVKKYLLVGASGMLWTGQWASEWVSEGCMYVTPIRLDLL